MHHPKYERSLRQKQLPTIWELPDAMWEHIEPLLPPEKSPGTPGRPVVPFRKVVNGVLYVLRTGCQWKAVPDQYGSGSTVHRRFQEWTQAGIFDAIVQMVLTWYDQVRGIAWKWQVEELGGFNPELARRLAALDRVLGAGGESSTRRDRMTDWT